MTHDEIISNLFAEYDKVSKKRVVELFLSSLSTRKLLWRIGLPIIAIMRTFPNHLFCVANNSVPSNISPCQVCGDFQCLYETEEDICEFLDGGGVLAHSIGDYYYGLKAINSLPSSSPQEVDIGIFHKIIACLKHSSGSIRTVQRELKNIPNFKSNVEERRLLLETLGYCGVLCPLNILLPIVTMSALIMLLAPAIHQTGTTLQIFGKFEMELILKLLIFGLGIISCRFHCKKRREELSRFRRLHHPLPLSGATLRA